jgi:hypothetical protein
MEAFFRLASNRYLNYLPTITKIYFDSKVELSLGITTNDLISLLI